MSVITDNQRAIALQKVGHDDPGNLEALVHATLYVGDQLAWLAGAVENACKIGGALDRRNHTTSVERGSA